VVPLPSTGVLVVEHLAGAADLSLPEGGGGRKGKGEHGYGDEWGAAPSGTSTRRRTGGGVFYVREMASAFAKKRASAAAPSGTNTRLQTGDGRGWLRAAMRSRRRGGGWPQRPCAATWRSGSVLDGRGQFSGAPAA
jgi:hypothetical protein